MRFELALQRSRAHSPRGSFFFPSVVVENGAKERSWYATANKQTSKLMFVICRNELILEYAHTTNALDINIQIRRKQIFLFCVNDVMRAMRSNQTEVKG